MPANRLALLLLIPAFSLIYLAWTRNPHLAPFMIPFLVAAVAVYVLGPQINWWWYSTFPPRPNPTLQALMNLKIPEYPRLSPKQQQAFCHRVFMFKMGQDWTPIGFPENTLPAEVKTAISAQAVRLCLHKKDFLFPKFEKVIVYPLPFPSPNFPPLHAGEINREDGCILLSARETLAAFANPTQYFNIALYEYAKIYCTTYPDDAATLTALQVNHTMLEHCSQIHSAVIVRYTACANPSLEALLIHHYFAFNPNLNRLYPTICNTMDTIFKSQEKDR